MDPNKKSEDIRRDPRKMLFTRDPEFDIPDPDQFEEEAEDLEEPEEWYHWHDRNRAS